jgi:protein-tyrosine phosphatase
MEANADNVIKRCHWGSTFVFQWEGLTFFGGGSFRGMDTTGMDVVIDCGAGVQQCRKGNRNSSSLQQQWIIRLGWPDGGVPEMQEKDWRDLLDLLQELSRRRKSCLKVLVCCVGGHGRTGTALSILAALSGVEPENPVGFIRQEYCRRAVETKPQCSYIRKIAKLDSEDDPATPESGDSCESDLRWP